MNKIIGGLFLGLLLLACSGSTKLTVSYIQENHQPKKYNKLAILALANTDPNRFVIEDAIAVEFKKLGVNALSTFNIFPLAGRPDVLADMEFTEEDVQNHIRETIKKNKIDALMILSLLDTRTTERYVSNTTNVGYYYPGYPAYGYRYYDYYTYAYGATRPVVTTPF